MIKSSVVTVRLGLDLDGRLDRLAQRTRRSKSWLAGEAIADYVERNAWQIAEIEAGLAELDAGDGIDEPEAERRFARLIG